MQKATDLLSLQTTKLNGDKGSIVTRPGTLPQRVPIFIKTKGRGDESENPSQPKSSEGSDRKSVVDAIQRGHCSRLFSYPVLYYILPYSAARQH